MKKRYAVLWFRHLLTDRFVRSNPALKGIPFVLSAPEKGRVMVKSVSKEAKAIGLSANRVLADCRAIFPSLQVFDFDPGQAEKTLTAIAGWCMRFTPDIAVDLPDSLILDISGCAHLWGGERTYLQEMIDKMTDFGYDVNACIADTVGTAWAVSHYGSSPDIIPPCCETQAIRVLPPAALRIESVILERLEKLGLYTIGHFIDIPRNALRRRFGEALLLRLDQARGQAFEMINPLKPAQPCIEVLPCPEPIGTAKGIAIALKELLGRICDRLGKEEKGLRKCILKAYRLDGKTQEIGIGTGRPSRNVMHLFKLFELHISGIAPGLGIEMFMMEAALIEELSPAQDALWMSESKNNTAVAELLDRIGCKLGTDLIARYLPEEHFWPERSYSIAASLNDKSDTQWNTGSPRPICILAKPERIEVTAPIPDYPPMLFRYKGVLHKVKKADGPERIEQEWWLQNGLFRDYYCIEDESGGRYWLFRSGCYIRDKPEWFIHGFFA